jgi:hypothetical protein
LFAGIAEGKSWEMVTQIIAHCLWSKHVDKNPGDRAEKCGGMMKPVSVIKTKGDFSIIHQCQVCGFEKKNKLAPEDDFDKVVRLSKGESE